ncbi:MAG: dehydrogenase [Rhizobacter sp.]|nr:dehydrogenase [Rhizobacter sp.]
MKIFVTGYSGFIGSHLVSLLYRRGHQIVLAGRSKPRSTLAGMEWAQADLAVASRPADWLQRLQGVDVVVNAVGILRESKGQTFDALHARGPAALFDACLAAGVRRVVQISALGADAQAQTAYHRSKKAADDHLLQLPISSVVVQPSLVFGIGGASSQLFMRLATLPLLVVPAGGEQLIQPIHIDDLCEALCRFAEASSIDAVPVRGRVALVGPEPITLRDYLQTLRHALGLPDAPVMSVPAAWMNVAASWVGRFPRVPLDKDSWSMLQRGNVAASDGTVAVLGRPPLSVRRFIAPSSASPLRQWAQLGWLVLLLRLSIALVWLGTAAVSFGLYPVADSLNLLTRTGVPASLAPFALYSAAALDLVFGVATLFVWRQRWLWAAQAALIVVYTLIITVRLPEFWLHPYAPMLKNLPMLALLGLLYVLDTQPRREPPWNT